MPIDMEKIFRNAVACNPSNLLPSQVHLSKRIIDETLNTFKFLSEQKGIRCSDISLHGDQNTIARFRYPATSHLYEKSPDIVVTVKPGEHAESVSAEIALETKAGATVVKQTAITAQTLEDCLEDHLQELIRTVLDHTPFFIRNTPQFKSGLMFEPIQPA